MSDALYNWDVKCERFLFIFLKLSNDLVVSVYGKACPDFTFGYFVLILSFGFYFNHGNG